VDSPVVSDPRKRSQIACAAHEAKQSEPARHLPRCQRRKGSRSKFAICAVPPAVHRARVRRRRLGTIGPSNVNFTPDPPGRDSSPSSDFALDWAGSLKSRPDCVDAYRSGARLKESAGVDKGRCDGTFEGDDWEGEGSKATSLCPMAVRNLPSSPSPGEVRHLGAHLWSPASNRLHHSCARASANRLLFVISMRGR